MVVHLVRGLVNMSEAFVNVYSTGEYGQPWRSRQEAIDYQSNYLPVRYRIRIKRK